MSTPAYLSGSSVQVSVPLPVVNGAVLFPSAVAVAVTDEAGVLVSTAPTVAAPTTGSTVSVALGSAYNTLATGELIKLRRVKFTMTTTAGVFIVAYEYVVRSATPLVKMVNSFMTLPEATLTRYQLPKADGWDASDEDQRIAAMISAYKNLLQLRYRFRIGQNSQSRIVDVYGSSVESLNGRIYSVINDMSSYAAGDFDSWTPEFQEALRRAQVAEADTMLAGDVVGDKRRQGIVAEKTGEASMQFRNVPDIILPVSRDALQHLRGFLNNSVQIARA